MLVWKWQEGTKGFEGFDGNVKNDKIGHFWSSLFIKLFTFIVAATSSGHPTDAKEEVLMY